MESNSQISSQTHIAELGRFILAGELDTIRLHQEPLAQQADVIAVHETRKAIRQIFTAIKLFHAFFEPGVLKSEFGKLRKLMRRLGRSRDISVFLQKLAIYSESNPSLPSLEAYWQQQLVLADDSLREYLAKPGRAALMDELERFVQSPGEGVPVLADPFTPTAAGLLLPSLIYDRLAAVRVFDGQIADASLKQLHQLRIQVKELRYSLRFFDLILGEQIAPLLETLEEMQELFGNLNDARVSIDLLSEMPQSDEEVLAYRAAKEAEISQLIAAVPTLWSTFNSTAWRQGLAAALAAL